jgi:hypothetical protein
VTDRRRHHPQVIRAKELTRAAGLNPYAWIERDGRGWRHREPQYQKFMDAAFDEHFARVAVDNIFWDQGGSWYAERWDIPQRDGDCHFWYGRCKSGSRWFWCVRGWIKGHTFGFDADAFKEQGYAGTEAEALTSGTAAIKRFAAGQRTIVSFQHGSAAYELKQINKAKRTARLAAQPSSATDSKAAEYLYGHTYGGEESDGHPVRFRIIKKTAKRIFYLRRGEEIDTSGEPVTYENIHSSSDFDEEIGFVDRQKLEATGEVYNNARHWCYSDFHLHASLQGLLSNRYSHCDEDQPDLRQLKAEMAAAHPDRGGSSAAFIAARQRYLAARRKLELTQRTGVR